MEKFRMLSLTEHVPEIGLPNRQIHDALMQIDLNGLIARLERIDIKLRRIWQYLAKHNYYNLQCHLRTRKVLVAPLEEAREQ
ncbi:MAG TPA: hypothetical protein VFZ58_00605 [Candidatus Saccharimonadales bacterium]